MTTVLWIVSGIAAFMFMMTGAMKLMQPKEKMQEKMAWVEDFDQNQIRLIGIAEVMGALGLILPALTGILFPLLSGIAALALVGLMLGAAATHIRRGDEYPMLGMNMMLIALTGFLAYSHLL